MVRRLKYGLVLAIAATAGVVGVVSRDAGATQQPVEMKFACALKSNGLMRYVSNLNQCKATEEKVNIHPGPVKLCVQPDGSTRKVNNFGNCRPPAMQLTLPPASGNVYFCAWNTTGVLRYVTSPSQCTSSEFPVFVQPNDDAPAVTTTSPGNGATNVAVNTNLTVNFSESVSVSTSSFTLICGGNPKSFTVSGSPGSSITLDPTVDLPEGTSCAVTAVANNISDTDTNDPPDHPAANYSFSFTTDSAPSVTSTSPADGSTDVAASTNIGVTFSEAVTVDTSSFTIVCDGNSLTFQVSGTGTSSITLNPDSDLPTAHCAVTAIAANISDVDGGDPPDHPAANYSFIFATHDNAPSVTTISPADAADHVAVNTNIVVNFSEPVTASGSSFTLECPTGTPKSFAVSGSPGSSITLDPTSDLPEGTICSVKVLGNNISDVDTVDPPDNMAADFNFSFTTDSAPAVTTTTPADGATDVDPTSNITVNFSEAVDVDSSSFTISCNNNSLTFQVSGTGTSSITLNPDSDLPSTASCTVTAVAANISDSDSGDPPDHPGANTSFSFTTPSQVSGAAVVVSQVYGGGGNSGATYKNDFIELYNRSAAAVSVTGWSVQYAATTGTTWQRTALSGTIAAGSHYLVQEAAGAGGTVNLPPPDATGSIPMSATAGKVVLMSNNTTIASGTICPLGAVDIVGYGSGTNCSETLPTATLSNTTAALRKGGGSVDTDNNSADFIVGAPNPRNSGDAAPTVSSTNPADGAAGVALDSNITITFSEPVNVTGSWFSISCSSSDGHTASVSGGPTTFTLDPSSDFVGSETCTVTVFAANVTDQDATDPPDNMAANYVFSFATVAPPVAIHDIQRAAHISPLAGQNVSNVNGIVTAKRSNGFYMQDPNPDADSATSEGIFVFTSSAPGLVNVGDAVQVSGHVQEFRPGGSSSANLTTTELTTPTTTVLSTGNPLPAPIVAGTGGRIPPDTVIEDDATGDVETSGVFDPASDGLDFWESLEGMRVQLNDPVAVGPTNAFGETSVVGDDGANAGLHTARGGLLLQPTDANPERLVADDVLVSLPAMNVGDHYDAPLVGVLDYNFGNFFLEVTSAGVGAVHDGVTPESTTPAGLNQVSVGTFNFENLDPTDPQSKFDRLAGILVNNLKSPDIVSGEEVQDDNGPTDNGVVDANQTLDQLVAAIQAAGGPTYDYRYINPVNDQDGGEPGGNIRQVFLFRTDRGLSFVDRPGGDSTTPTTVVNGPDGPELSFSPGRIDPTNSAFTASRKPLAGEFLFNSHHLFVIANHFNSKGGDQPLEGHFQPPTRSSEVQRHQQAQIVHDFVASILADDANANVIVAGDLNDFEWSDTVSILKSGVLHDLIDTLPLNERYSYVFEGNSQTLDHILTSDALFAQPFAYDVVHVNAEFADQASDHDPSAVKITFNAAPTDIQLSNNSINENQSSGTDVGTLTTTDPDAGDTHTYTLESSGCGGGSFPDNSSFQIGGVGNDKLQSAASFDFETKNSYTICVRSTDSGSLSFDKQFTISVNDVTEP